VLLDLGGKPIVQHVIQRALGVLDKDKVILATDHEEIAQVGERLGIRVIMTDEALPNGTMRCIRALESIGLEPQHVINLQADEPFVSARDLERIFEQLDCGDEVVTLAMEATNAEEYRSAHHVKVVCDHEGKALYFSRAPIPWGVPNEALAEVRLHIGIYGFRFSIMKSLVKGEVPLLARREQLEQLSWLWQGKSIRVLMSLERTISIDTWEDYERALRRISSKGLRG